MITVEKIRDDLTGEIFEVKKIVKEWRLLGRETNHWQCLMGLNTLKLLCERAPESFHAVGVQL